MKPGIYRCHPLNRHLGRARIAGGVSKQNSHSLKDKHVIFRLVVLHLPHASYAYKNIGYVTDVIEISC